MRALPPSTPAFSAAIVTEGWVHVSGQIGTDAQGRIAEGCAEQARISLEKIDMLLRQAGSSREHLVKLTAYLVDAADYPHYANAKKGWVAQPAPAGTVVVVAGLLTPGARIEIEAIARIPQ
ncbi:MAG: endoribonuclease [Ramlibacter sp.]|nr:endoribonuclease [Ramlibacter sp.]